MRRGWTCSMSWWRSWTTLYSELATTRSMRILSPHAVVAVPLRASDQSKSEEDRDRADHGPHGLTGHERTVDESNTLSDPDRAGDQQYEADDAPNHRRNSRRKP